MPKVKTVRMVLKLHPDFAEAFRALVEANPPLTLSGFAQDAIARSMRSWRPAEEFIASSRERQGKSPLPGSLDTRLDRPDGVPLACASDNSELDWREVWRLSSGVYVQNEINRMRLQLQRPALTGDEWSAIVKHMGQPPGQL